MIAVPVPSLADTAGASFAAVFGKRADDVAWAPGRVNLIGEHTDYNEGFVLPMAIDRGIAVAFARRDDDRLRVHATLFNDTREITPDQPQPRQLEPHWSSYAAGVMWAIRRAGQPICGLDLIIVGDVPMGAGLSSSAAVEVAVARAACAAANVAWEPMRMARLAQEAEREFVGVPCGIMDQVACAAARTGCALLVDCRTLDVRHVPMPKDAAVLILDSGVRRTLAASAYAERRAACQRAVSGIRTIAPDVVALRDVDTALLTRSESRMDEVAFRRARHVVGENVRPLSMADALGGGDVETAGRLMSESHASLRHLYEVSSPELDAMVEAAVRCPGCYGARMTGAGFGGCAVALVAARDADVVMRDVEQEYRQRTGRRAACFVSRPMSGAALVAGR